MTENKLKILLVDDEPDIVSVIRLGLEKYGFYVDAFTDPLDALSHFKPDYYDEIILDIKMPNMNGFELSRKIYQQEKDAKVCFLSAFDIHEDEAKKVLTNLNSFCFLKKPIGIDDLIAHIKKHIS